MGIVFSNSFLHPTLYTRGVYLVYTVIYIDRERLMLKAQVVKWGNSLAVRIPKAVAQKARVQEGDSIVIEALDGQIESAALREFRPSRNWLRVSPQKTVTRKLHGGAREVRKSLNGSCAMSQRLEISRGWISILRPGASKANVARRWY